MGTRNSDEEDRGEKVDLERRLTAYYGPALSEQPLSQTSWERLRSQLHSGHPLKRRFHLSKKRSQAAVPTHIQETFARIAYQASVVYIPARLHCTFKSKRHIPVVRISPLDRRNMKLVLPSMMRGTMSQAELDVLLATGLARYVCRRRSLYVLMPLLLLSIALLVGVAIVMFSTGTLRGTVILITTVLGALLYLVLLGWSNRARRRLAFRADELMVTWLGRGHVCQGLHALANSLHTSRHQGWGEPSLDERIERVCGTQVRVEDPRLTMAR
jgi:hypothetical protein